MEKKGIFHRFFWSFIYITLLSCTIFMVVTLWEQFLLHPTVTTLTSSTHPVKEVPFPGVAICSLNKISKRRARILALEIARLTGRNEEEMMKYVHFLGQLYDFDFEPSTVTDLLEFQNILDSLKLRVIDLVRKLATPCDELLQNCTWQGKEVDCTSIFFLRLTNDGYCCIFNYVKLTKEILDYDLVDKSLTTDSGVENGLYVAVKNDLNDYYYTTLSATGVVVDIFVPSDYPDKPSGSVTEILTYPNSESFIEIEPTTLISVPDVADYAVERRSCLFEYERGTTLDKTYSSSDCEVQCRTTSIQAICQCVPFLFPFSNDTTVCTLADIPCLSRYKDKWNTLFPEGVTGPYLLKERQDSVFCEKKCYPSCSETGYTALTNSFPIYDKSQERENITHVYVYYLRRFSRLYIQDVVYYWFEVLSCNFGGIFGIFVGWSLIFMMQLLVYYVRWMVESIIKINALENTAV